MDGERRDLEEPEAEPYDRDEYFAVGSKPFLRRVAIAPICLCLIAGVHLYRVVTSDQTQWKGGGFGMFSTVDSRNARFLRVYVVTADQEIPVTIPNAVRKRVTELRALPSRQNLDLVADALAKYRWHQPRDRWRRIADGLNDLPTNQVVARGKLHPPPDWNNDAELSSPGPGQRWPVDAVFGRKAVRARDDLVPAKSLRIELWRYQYDGARNQITARRQMETSRLIEEGA